MFVQHLQLGGLLPHIYDTIGLQTAAHKSYLYLDLVRLSIPISSAFPAATTTFNQNAAKSHKFVIRHVSQKGKLNVCNCALFPEGVCGITYTPSQKTFTKRV